MINNLQTFEDLEFTVDSETSHILRSQLNEESLHNIKSHYTNGLSKFVKKSQIEVVKDIKKCKFLWNEFSQNKSIFDTWNFRYSFYLSGKFPPHFITLQRDSEILAVLPLSFDEVDKKYKWFGSEWPEDNIFFSKNPVYIPLLLFLAPTPLVLNSLLVEEIKKVPSFIKFVADDSKFILDLKNMKTLHDYLSRLRKKKRYNLKRDKKRIELLNPKVVINNFSDYDQMIKICNERFHTKGKLSDFEEYPFYIKIFKEVIKNSNKSYKPRMVSVFINDKLAAADMLGIYKDIYYPLHGGAYNIEDYPGIGNYINLVEIEDAISLGMKKMDFLAIEYGWKKSWFDEIILYKYEKT